MIRIIGVVGIVVLLPATDMPQGYEVHAPQTCSFSAATSYWECDPTVVLLCPKGDGGPVAVGAFILCANSSAIDPPADAGDVRLTWNSGTGPCSLDSEESIHMFEADKWHANADTDPGTGFTQITMSPCASGFSESGHIMPALFIGGSAHVFTNPPASASCLPIAIRSPDFNGDGVVGLVDLATFGNEYPTTSCGGDPACREASLDGDDDVDTVDFAIFGAHNNHCCEDCPRTATCPQVPCP